MIKKIYTTWVSTKPYPEKYLPFLEGWKSIMPDYEIEVISLSSVVKSKFVVDAIKLGKYALAGHYGRCERLYETGGLYFDIDVEVLKRFDPLLGKSFIGREDAGMVNNAVMGFEKGHPMLKACLDFMDSVDITIPNIELETGPWLFNNLYKDFDVKVYPEEYFYPYHYTKTFTPECIKENTYAIHRWGHTWG